MESTKDHKKNDAILSLVGSLLVFLFLLTTDPTQLPVELFIIFPVLIGVVSFALTRLLVSVFLPVSEGVKKSTGIIVGATALLVVMLSTLGQLGFQDMLLAVLLAGGLMFYVRRLHQKV